MGFRRCSNSPPSSRALAAGWPPELGEQADADTGLRWLTGSYVWAFVSAPDTRQTRSVLIQLGTLVPCWP